jgi:L-threonylcarbamoyladenylate synthase
MTQDLAPALRVLEAGGVVAAATETLFGLLADATRPEAIARVALMKARADKAFPLLLPGLGCWSLVAGEVPELALGLARRFWPGPLTLAVPARSGLDHRLVHSGTVAARWPLDSPAARLCQALGRPVTATSANLPGATPTSQAAAVREAFASAVAAGELFVLDEPAPGGPPSTIVVVRGAELEIVREGAIPALQIADAVRELRGPRK